MGLSAKMKPWPHPAFPDSSLLPVPGRRALQVKAGLSLCEWDTGKAGLAHRVTPRGPVFSPGPRWTTFSFFPLPSPGLRQTLEQTLSTVVHSLCSQKRLAVPTESSKDFLSHLSFCLVANIRGSGNSNCHEPADPGGPPRSPAVPGAERMAMEVAAGLPTGDSIPTTGRHSAGGKAKGNVAPTRVPN